MSSQLKSMPNKEDWPNLQSHHEILPTPLDDNQNRPLLSDAVKLRIATTLQSSLHVRDVIKGFADEARRVVRGVSVRYRNRSHKVAVESGTSELNRYTYELNLVGRSLGQITFSRGKPLTDSEQATLEVVLCSLVHPLRNALQYESALKVALKDPLTGVNNRASMGAHLKHHISLAARQSTPLSLLIIDVDHFKSVNDQFGHIVGDVTLTQVAKSIVGCTRTSDGVFRYGGEEFIVVLPSTDAEGAERLAERIRETIEAMRVDAVADDVSITASVGVAHLLDGESQNELLQRADDMLLAAKRNGRNRVVVADATPPSQTETTSQ